MSLRSTPRASRTVFLCPRWLIFRWAQVATRLILGETLAELWRWVFIQKVQWFISRRQSSPLPSWRRLSAFLGPEMKSTKEVMAVTARSKKHSIRLWGFISICQTLEISSLLLQAIARKKPAAGQLFCHIGLWYLGNQGNSLILKIIPTRPSGGKSQWWW